MRGQEFERVRGALLRGLEALTVEEHRQLLGGPGWAPPDAYRWIRYENPDPVGRLLAAGERLEALWAARPAAERAAFAEREGRVVAEAAAQARRLGYAG